MKHSIHIHRAAAILLCACLLLACLPMTVWAEETNSTETALPVCYQQNDPRWGAQEQLAPGGCGILSLVNAVHFLTGNFINPVELAAYARSIDAYYGSVGGGTARWVLYHQLDEYEKTYGFDVVQTGKDAGAKHQTLIDHLSGGGTAVAHVKGHFIALCGYDAQTDSMLVYDPAATHDRQTTVEPQWKTTTFLSTHSRMTVDWWCLISRTGDTSVTVEQSDETGKNRELYPTVRHGQDKNDSLILRGSVRHSSAVQSFFCVVDYDYDHIVELTGETETKGRTTSFEVSVDLSGLKLGQHTLRLSARCENGAVVDIAEYSLFVTDGKDGYDPLTGTLTVNMSGFFGQTGVRDAASSMNYDGLVFRSAAETVLYIGKMDLSKYTAVRFYYSVKETFFGQNQALLGLRSTPTTFGFRNSTVEMTEAVAAGNIPEAAYPLAAVQAVTVDLTDCDYHGDLWFAVYHPVRQPFYLRKICFYTGDVPAFEVITEETTAEPVTEPATDAPTDTVADSHEGSSSGGCAAGMWGGFWPAVLGMASCGLLCLTVPRRSKKAKRGGSSSSR